MYKRQRHGRGDTSGYLPAEKEDTYHMTEQELTLKASKEMEAALEEAKKSGQLLVKAEVEDQMCIRDSLTDFRKL